MFILKKILSRFLFPVPFCLEMLVIGLFLLFFTKMQKTGKLFITLGFLLLFLFSTAPLPEMALGHLEYKYPVLQTENLPQNQIDWIVVLGGGYNQNKNLPLSSRVQESTLFRVNEALRLHKALPHSKLLFSGGQKKGSLKSSAEIMAELTKSMDCQAGDIFLEKGSHDTKDQVLLIKDIIKNEPFILVTSASHMPRAVLMFENNGLSPIPAPTHFLVDKQPKRIWEHFPSYSNLQKMQRAVYEYLGLLWAAIRGQINIAV